MHNIHTIGAFEAKTHLSSLLVQVEKGEQIIITRHGLPIAKLSPIAKNDQKNILLAIKHLKEFGKHNTLGNLDWKSLKEMGRK